jgi:hypothetical protein
MGRHLAVEATASYDTFNISTRVRSIFHKQCVMQVHHITDVLNV